MKKHNFVFGTCVYIYIYIYKVIKNIFYLRGVKNKEKKKDEKRTSGGPMRKKERKEKKSLVLLNSLLIFNLFIKRSFSNLKH